MGQTRILIVGGGIGGLSLARELFIRGLSVTVLEKTPQLSPVGAGIIMNPNAMRMLEQNGLAIQLRERGWPYLVRETYDHRGNLLAVRDYRPLYDSGKIAAGTLVHRAHLHNVLFEGIPPDTVRFGTKITRMDLRPDGVRVQTDGDETWDAGLLVGADGIHSSVREQFFGKTAPFYLGYRSHRLILENNVQIEHFTEFLGRGQRIGFVPISKDQLYVWTTFNSPRDGHTLGMESARHFRQFFRAFTDERVRKVFSQIESTDGIICTDIEEIWQNEWVKGRVVLLGDAAHALSPNIGQGAGMAMEDAAVLAQELDSAQRANTALGEALSRYVTRRKPRVEHVMRLSREVGVEGQRSNPIACWLRNRRIQRQNENTRKSLEELERLLAYPL